MLFSFHRVKLAPRVSALAVIAVAAAGAVWAAWPRPLIATPPTMTRSYLLDRVQVQRSSESCILIESVSQYQGTLVVNPDGTAWARFGNDEFTGTVRGGSFSLTLDKQFDWEDGCRWETHQTISGYFGCRGGGVGFHYTEQPLPGQTGCLPTCSGEGRVSKL